MEITLRHVSMSDRTVLLKLYSIGSETKQVGRQKFDITQILGWQGFV